MKRWMLGVFLQKVLNFGRGSPMKEWTKKTFLKHTHTNLQRQINKQNPNVSWKWGLLFWQKEVIFHWEPIFLFCCNFLGQSLASIPRLGHHISRVCPCCGGYMKYRNSFCLFSSTLWRSDPFEDSDRYRVFTPRCAAPHPRQWRACLTFLLTHPRENRTQ